MNSPNQLGRRDITITQYHESDGISRSGLNTIMTQSPAHFVYRKQYPLKTRSINIGAYVHDFLMLDSPEKLYRSLPDINRRTNAGKEAYASLIADNPGITFLDPLDMLQVKEIVDSIRQSSEVIRSLVFTGENETSWFWKDPTFEVLCKCRPDILHGERRTIVDIKTTGHNARQFPREIGKYNYHMQAAFYVDGMKECGVEIDCFVFVVVETEPPYGVACYLLDNESIEGGRFLYRGALKTYAACLQQDRWHGYPGTIEPIKAPKWAMPENQFETDDEGGLL